MESVMDIFLTPPKDIYRCGADKPTVPESEWYDNTQYFSRYIGEAVGASLEESIPRRGGYDRVTCRFGMDIEDTLVPPYEERSVIW